MFEHGQPLQPELPITDFDAIEFYVGNAKQAAYYYRHALGFDVVGYRGPETGCREQASYYLRQGGVEFVLSAGLTQDSPIVQHVKRHGDGVREIRLKCTNVIEAFNTALERGATPVYAPKTLEDKDGVVHKAAIQTYGDTIHVFVDRRDYQGVFEPGYEACQSTFGKTPPVGLNRVDHIVGNVYEGALDRWVDFYRNVFGFRVLCEFSEEDIKTDNTALASKVVANESLSIRMPINVPAEGKGRSQIKEYLDYYHSEGAQHIAIACQDVVASVRQMRENGLGFIYVPQTYFEASKARIGSPEELVSAQSWDDLAAQGILVDAERSGYLLQLFTQPQEDLPTFFFEFIQRVGGAVGFGHGNFQALFESIEREQALRGNL